jgi:hypothetical protein
MKKASWTAAAAIAALAAFPAAARGAPGEWVWPVRGAVITHYLNDDARPYAGGMHRGIDIAAPAGTPVVAAAGGTVTFAGTAGSSGLTVAIRTADGRFDTSYLHLSSIAVRAGEAVAAGARVGAVGITGRRSLAAPHLHFGVREAGSRHAYVDPLRFLGPPPGPGGIPAVPRAVPLLAPARPAPSPSPFAVPSPALAAVPRTAPAPATQPRAGRRFVPGRLPRGARAARPGAAPRPAGAPAGAPLRGENTAPVPEGRGAPGAEGAPAPSLGSAPAGGVQPGHGAVASGERRVADPSRPGGGPDLGRILALAGLLAALAAASRPAERRAVRDRGRVVLGALLRPLATRR